MLRVIIKNCGKLRYTEVSQRFDVIAVTRGSDPQLSITDCQSEMEQQVNKQLDSRDQGAKQLNVNEAPQSSRQSIVSFIESLKTNKEFESNRDLIRIVPRGLFVDERGLERIVTSFQKWIYASSQGSVDKTVEKTKQWLFEDEIPERLYLVEGKQVLAGYLIPLAIQNPQRFGLPFYLGSLLPAAEYLHPADPELRSLKGIEVRQGPRGLEVIVSRGDKKVTIPEVALKAFRQLADGSSFLRRRYPGCEKSMLVALSALSGLARRARPVPKTFPVIVPQSIKGSKTQHLRAAGKFLFIEDRGILIKVIEMHGRHLSSFLRDELNRAPRDKLGFFKLTPKHRDLVGYYDVGGRRSAVHARAFAEFAELVRRARDPRERFAGWFTAADCFERFSSIYQMSQPIPRAKIAASLERFGIEGSNFKLCGGWIFALSREGTVMRTVARHIRLPGHRRGKD